MTSDGKITHSISVGTSFGVLCLIASERGLTGARFIPDVGAQDQTVPILTQASLWVQSYFAGKPLPLTINFDEPGHPFNVRCGLH